MDTMVYTDSNQKQDYATHPMFRYFGKLPPTLVARLMDQYCPAGGRVLELMCGSGTTLVEAYLRGMPAVGIDINPLSVLISRAKTTKIESEPMLRVEASLRSFTECPPDCAYAYFRPSTRNLDYWFSPDAQRKLSALKYFIEHEAFWSIQDNQIDSALKNLLLVTFAGIIRKISNASPRTGRIFRCAEESAYDAFEEMRARFQSNMALVNRLPDAAQTCEVLCTDARQTGLAEHSFDFILNHPPYFALYKYSSDVLRFELEWLSVNRSEVARQEITDGFKTTDEGLLDAYIRDMKDVLKEMHRLMRDGANACLVVSDSKLREKQLPVVDQLVAAAEETGLRIESHMLRPVSFAQASYHKSANPNIRTNEDHVLILQRAR